MHVAIIMNGNGRWAVRRGLPPTACNVEGAAALCAAVDSALRAGVRTLTLYALSCAAQDSTVPDIEADLLVLAGYLRSEGRHCVERAVRISVIGHGRRLGAARLSSALEESGSLGATDARLHLRIVIDYSAHDSVVQSAWGGALPRSPESFTQQLRELDHTALPAGAVDLLIRTGGGQCRSDFMLWEVAYARLHCVDCLWPDFTAHHFQSALDHLGEYLPACAS